MNEYIFIQKNEVVKGEIVMESKQYYKLTKGQKFYYRVKSIGDRIAGMIGLVVDRPVFLGIGILIKKEEGLKAPVFFYRKELGRISSILN